MNTDNQLHAATTLIFERRQNCGFKTLINENGYSIGVFIHIGQFISHPMPVHGHISPTTMSTRLRNFEPLTLIASNDSHGVTSFQTCLAQTVD